MFVVAVGKVFDASGNSKYYFTFNGNIGYGAGMGFEKGEITPTGSHQFQTDDIGGKSGSYTVGVSVGSVDMSISRGGSLERNWSGREKINPLNFGKNEKAGYKHNSRRNRSWQGIIWSLLFIQHN